MLIDIPNSLIPIKTKFKFWQILIRISEEKNIYVFFVAENSTVSDIYNSLNLIDKDIKRNDINLIEIKRDNNSCKLIAKSTPFSNPDFCTLI
jgi:hypothetical protein